MAARVVIETADEHASWIAQNTPISLAALPAGRLAED
jgi:hypothetical protein